MKNWICLISLALIAMSAHALEFTIAPGTGYSEPLNDGDIIEIDATLSPSVGHSYSNSWWQLYYNSTLLGEVLTPGTFNVDPGTGVASGSDALVVDVYTAANRVGLHLATSFAGQWQWYSDNLLEVLPTAPMTPSTSVWGLIVLLVAVPFIVLWRR